MLLEFDWFIFGTRLLFLLILRLLYEVFCHLIILLHSNKLFLNLRFELLQLLSLWLNFLFQILYVVLQNFIFSEFFFIELLLDSQLLFNWFENTLLFRINLLYPLLQKLHLLLQILYLTLILLHILCHLLILLFNSLIFNHFPHLFLNVTILLNFLEDFPHKLTVIEATSIPKFQL